MWSTLEFSEPIENDAVPNGSVQLRDTLTGKALDVLEVAVRSPNRLQYQLITALQESLATYRSTVTGVRDSAGNAISPIANSLTFSPELRADTAGFSFVAASVRDSTRSLPFRPTIELYGSRPAKSGLAPGAVTLSDTLGRSIPVELAWKGSLTLSVRPARYYLVAILFILFDLEMAFLFPWAVALHDIGASGYWAMMLFLLILVVGFAYEWKKGALDWE